MSKLQQAIAIATTFHKDQFRKTLGKTIALPYVVHPIEVMKTLWNWGVHDEDTLTAAILHDTLEDTQLLEEDIRSLFGSNVAFLVKQLTFDPVIESKVDHLKGFESKSLVALIIKVSDRVCNVLDFDADNDPYAAKYFRKARDLFTAFIRRRQDIEAVFGKDVWHHAYNTVCSVADELGIAWA